MHNNFLFTPWLAIVEATMEATMQPITNKKKGQWKLTSMKNKSAEAHGRMEEAHSKEGEVVARVGEAPPPRGRMRKEEARATDGRVLWKEKMLAEKKEEEESRGRRERKKKKRLFKKIIIRAFVTFHNKCWVHLAALLLSTALMISPSNPCSASRSMLMSWSSSNVLLNAIPDCLIWIYCLKTQTQEFKP